jgi:hypothetical protein
LVGSRPDQLRVRSCGEAKVTGTGLAGDTVRLPASVSSTSHDVYVKSAELAWVDDPYPWT